MKEYNSIRKKKSRSIFTWASASAPSATVYWARGRRGKTIFRYKTKRSFTVGFRGGLEGLFYIQKRHCVSLGVFYEQRIIQGLKM